MKTHKKSKFFPYGMMMPTIVIFGLFMIYPVVYSFYLSFMEFSGGTYTFVGLQNYIELFKDPVFYKALFNTFFYLIIQVPVMIGLALLLAVLIEQKFIRGRGFFRMATFLPTITSLVAYALVFKVLFNTDHGLINYIIEFFGGDKSFHHYLYYMEMGRLQHDYYFGRYSGYSYRNVRICFPGRSKLLAAAQIYYDSSY